MKSTGKVPPELEQKRNPQLLNKSDRSGWEGVASVGELAGTAGRHILSPAATAAAAECCTQAPDFIPTSAPHPPTPPPPLKCYLSFLSVFYHSLSPLWSSSCFGHHSVSRFEPLSGKSFRNWQKSSLHLQPRLLFWPF